jgi:hypothetical protein
MHEQDEGVLREGREENGVGLIKQDTSFILVVSGAYDTSLLEFHY